MKNPTKVLALISLFFVMSYCLPSHLLANHSEIFYSNLTTVTTSLDSCNAQILEVEGGLEVDAFGSIYSYLWNTGDTTSFLAVSETGTYCVTVTDGIDCNLELCRNIFIGECAIEIQNNQGSQNINRLNTSIQGATSPFTYLWNTGETTSFIDATSSGDYCVTMTDVNNCTASDCTSFIYTDSMCLLTIISFPDRLETQVENAIAPIQYQWNSGETTATIFPNTSGDYCVTITDATGCTNQRCQSYTAGTCSVVVSYLSNEQEVQAIPSGTAPYTYIWQTGATTQSIPALEEGNYCVTMTDASGCTKSACQTINNNFQIAGTVTFANNDSTYLDQPIQVYLIQQNEDETWQKIDSVQFNNSEPNAYNFSNRPAGKYLVQATFLPTSPAFEAYFPTYYEQQLLWDEATVIELPYVGLANFSIEMIAAEGGDGPGVISGTITDGDNFTDKGDNTALRGLGETNGISILLLDNNDEAIKHTVSDENGDFSFSNLPLGSYRVYAELLSFEPAFFDVTLSQDAPASDNLNFELNDTTITDAEEITLSIEAFEVYPNPLKNQLNISWSGETTKDLTIKLIRLDGGTVFSKKCATGAEQRLSMPITNVSPGIYLLMITRERAQIVKKIVVMD